jgi:hypothetical protein
MDERSRIVDLRSGPSGNERLRSIRIFHRRILHLIIKFVVRGVGVVGRTGKRNGGSSAPVGLKSLILSIIFK